MLENSGFSAEDTSAIKAHVAKLNLQGPLQRYVDSLSACCRMGGGENDPCSLRGSLCRGQDALVSFLHMNCKVASAEETTASTQGTRALFYSILAEDILKNINCKTATTEWEVSNSSHHFCLTSRAK